MVSCLQCLQLNFIILQLLILLKKTFQLGGIKATEIKSLKRNFVYLFDSNRKKKLIKTRRIYIFWYGEIQGLEDSLSILQLKIITLKKFCIKTKHHIPTSNDNADHLAALQITKYYTNWCGTKKMNI